MNRRSFLALPALLPFVRPTGSGIDYHAGYDYILGTSLDLTVRCKDMWVGQRVETAVLREIERLRAILDTRDPASEICQQSAVGTSSCSSALGDVLRSYETWEPITGGALSLMPGGQGTARNVDALGKAYIADRALKAARAVSADIEAVRVNIGGDVVTWRSPQADGPDAISIVNPDLPFDNAPPLTRIGLRNCAVATSGTYARGAHLIDPRSHQAALGMRSVTVVGPDATTANALATAACVLGTEQGVALVESIAGAEALMVPHLGAVRRTAGFAAMELNPVEQPAQAAAWPTGYQVSLALNVVAGTLAGRGGRGRGTKRPYVGVYVEDPATNRLVRVIALWADQPRYYGELSVMFFRTGRSQATMSAFARATRPAGRYDLMWDGLNDARQPVPLGQYRIVVETNQEGGSYAKQGVVIECGAAPAEARLPGSVNVEAVTITYGPRPAT